MKKKKKRDRKREAKRELGVMNFAVKPETPAPTRSRAKDSSPPKMSARAARADELSRLPGGRVTADDRFDIFGGHFTVLQPPTESENTWRTLRLDDRALSRMSATRLIELMCDLSPDISKAVWDFNLFINPGFECHAYKPESDDTKDPKGEKALKLFINKLKEMYGSLDVVISRIAIGGCLRGGFFAELVLDDDGETPIDLATPDPQSVRFKRVDTKGPRGRVWEMGAYQGGNWVSYEWPTIRYIPIHPLPENPYGRSLVSPALFSALFLLGLLHDLKRVVQQQGYPRIDIVIHLEKLLAVMPDEIKDDPAEFKKWVDGAIKEVKDVYKALQPDDAFIHLDPIEVNGSVGAVDAKSLGAVDALIRAIERMTVRALKSMPLLMGTTDGVAEANANRQWEIHAQGIKSIQHLIETLLERLFTLALQAQGIVAEVRFRFSELRAAEELRDEQSRFLKYTNEAFAYAQGWQNNDQAAQNAVGHKADAEEPRQMTASSGGNVANLNPDPGANRVVLRFNTPRGVIKIKGTRDGFIPEGADLPLAPIPGTVTISDEEFDRAIADWDSTEFDVEGVDAVGLLSAEVIEG